MVINTIERESTRSGAPTDRAAREAATRELMERRAASTDEVERQEILEQVVELNLEMAKGIARRFRGRGAEADDLEQVAYLGLVKAAHHYRLEADTPFIGFAIPTIRGEVKRYFRDCAWTVRIPRRLQEMQGTIATTDGVRLWAFRYSTEGRTRSLFHNTDVATLRMQYPDNPTLHGLSDATRIVVSEPLGDLKGAWREVPEGSFLAVEDGEEEIRPFAPQSFAAA